MNRTKLLAIVFLLTGFAASAQRVATFEVNLDRPANGLSIPASVNLDDVTFLSDSILSLVEVIDNVRTTPVPFQIQQGDHRTITWNINTKSNSKKRKKKKIYN